MLAGSACGHAGAEHALLERADELAVLRSAVDRAADGVPTFTILLGEAGIGKSRLVLEVGAAASSDGVTVLRGDCVDFEGVELPYGPVAAAMRDVPANMMTAVWASLPREIRREIERSLPHVVPSEEPAGEPPATDPFAQGRLYESLFRLVRALTETAVVLLVVEDFHWVDPSTRDFLMFLARNLRRERIAVILTYRTDELGPRHPVRRLLGELRRMPGVTSLELRRLSRAAVEGRLEELVSERLPSEVIDAVFERTGGNPFFVEELSATPSSIHDGRLPPSLADALLTRYRDLPPTTRRVLQFAAAVAKPFDPTLLARAADMPEPELSAAVRQSCEHHLLVDADAWQQLGAAGARRAPPDAEHPPRLAFRHDVVREAIYTDLLAGERARIHEAIAHALDGAAEPAELAFHWRQAGPSATALEATIAAGLEAERARAFGDALWHFEAARSLAGELDEASADAPLDRVGVLSHAGDLAKYTGDSEGACRLYAEALSIVDPEADPETAAGLLERRGRCESYEEDAGLASYREALAVMPSSRPADRARLMSEEGFALTMLMRHEEALDRCTAALELALKADAPAEEGYARMMLGVALGFLADTDEGERQLRLALGLARAAGRAEDLLRAHLYLAEVLRLQGRLGDALAVTTEGEERARDLGMYLAFGRYMSFNAAADLLFVGRWDEAAARIEATGGVELEPWEALLREQVVGQLALGRGRLDAAERHLGEARRLYDEGAPSEFAPDVFAPLAELALWRDDAEHARVLIQTGLARLGDHADVLHAPMLFAMGARVEATAVERRRPRPSTAAPDLCRRLDELVETARGSGAPGAARAYQASCHAEAARAGAGTSEKLWRDAVDAWQALGAPYPAAYATWRRAEAILVAGGDRREAARVLADARTVTRALGATRLTAAIEELAGLHRLNLEDVGHPAPLDPADPAASLGLTPREAEVLALVVQGLTNRQIAGALVISEKTAGVHVSHIFAKLDVHNRAAATAAALHAGLVRGPSAGPTAT